MVCWCCSMRRTRASDAVHEDDADAREGVVVELADRGPGQLTPVEPLLVERGAFLPQHIERHRGLLPVRECWECVWLTVDDKPRAGDKRSVPA
jgi:hypothetical protein